MGRCTIFPRILTAIHNQKEKADLLTDVPREHPFYGSCGGLREYAPQERLTGVRSVSENGVKRRRASAI
jgi:hypothetical protein